MSGRRKEYPDNSGIFARKAQGRRQRASMSFSKKLAVLDEMKWRVEQMVRSRELRRGRHRPSEPNRG